jgi:hippurate hydrolase
MTRLPPLIVDHHAEFTAWRRDIHAHPELGFAESRTAALVAERLESFGIEVHRGVGRTGVVGVLRCGSSPRTIGLRADMDALPIEEANDFLHRSRHPGRMHACGHDGHTAMLLGAAKVLAATRHFDGTVHFVFQPAEEGLGGAKVERVPGCFFNIGNGEGEGGCEVHNPAYDFNDAAIPLGVGFFVRAAERKLAPDDAAR